MKGDIDDMHALYYNACIDSYQGGDTMPTVTIRKVPDEIHRAIKVKAANHGHSAEAEMREILAKAVQPEERVKLGSLLAAVGRELSLTDAEFETLTQTRDKTPAEPMGFE